MQQADGKRDSKDPPVGRTPTRTVDLHIEGQALSVMGDGFRLCPLGVQFRSESPLEPYAEMSINVVLPSDREDMPAPRLNLRGIVVQCDHLADCEYKVAMYFTDLDQEHYELIREASQCLPTLCPDCNLF